MNRDPSTWIVALQPPNFNSPQAMAARVRAFDWSGTPLGAMEQWPQALQMALSICLSNRFPMMIWWGPELTFIYNDAYAPMLGKRHPSALGQSGRDVWREIWPQLEQQVEAVMSRGESTWNDRIHLVIERNGFPEDTWFSWSYSPILDSHGRIGGLINTCREDTQQVLAERERDLLLERERAELVKEHQQAQNRARTILETITDAFFELDRDWKFTYINSQAEQLVGRTADELLGKNFLVEFPGVMGTEFETLNRRAMTERIAGSVTSYYPDHDRWYEVHSYPSPDGLSIYFRDVSERSRLESTRLRLLSEAERQARVFDAALSSGPDLAYIFDGDTRVQYANKALLELWGATLPEVIGKDFFDLKYPQDLAVKLTGDVQKVFKTGKRLMNDTAYTSPTGVSGHFEYIFSPVLGPDGTVEAVAGSTRDVTDRKQYENERERLLLDLKAQQSNLSAIIEQAPAFICTLKGPEHVFELANERYYEVVGRREIIGKTVREALPEIEGQGFFELLDNVYRTGETFTGNELPALIRRSDDHPPEWRFMNLVYRALHQADGTVSGIFVHGVDVTDLVRSREAVVEREAKFRQLADSMPQIVWTARPDGTLDYYNRRWFEYINVPQENAASNLAQWHQYVHPDDLGRVGQAWAVALQSGDIYNIEFRVRGESGDYRWFLVRAQPVREEAGNIIRWYGTCTDIEERKQIEEERAQLLARVAHQARVFDATLSSVRDFVFLFDRDGRFLYANKALLDLWGLAAEQAVGRTMKELSYSAEVELLLLSDIKKVFNTGQVVTNETAYTSPVGGPAYFEYILAPVIGSDGNVETVAGISRDVSDRRRAEQERTELLASEQAARVEAERASRMKDEFLATLSHELRTPLNAVLGWSQIMKASKDPEDLHQGLEVIERNARAQSQIIEDLLDMSRIISGKVRLDVQRVDLYAIVQAAVETARPTADAKGIRIQSVIDPLHGVAISGDPNRLQQVLWNLVSNAIKFTPKNGRVQVLLERVNSHFEISVIDTGEGIKAEFLPFVFDRFRQADASITRRHGGLGLGLSIVKQLVELHGGAVRVKSAGMGHGSTFVVSLPVTILHPEPDSGVERVHPRTPPRLTGARISSAEIRGVRVIVVDDEPDARLLIKRLLEDCNALVTATGSTDEAVAFVKSKKFDVLVSDIGMPGEDGYTLIKRIRALGKDDGGDIPAIALTAYARSEDRVKAVAAGFMMHVAKPVEPVELITMVAGAAGRTGS